MNHSAFEIYTDEELMGFVCKGNTKAFDVLYVRYHQKLFSFFIRLLGSSEMAKDALQDVFLKLAEKPQLFDVSKKFETWIFSIASNYCKNVFRHQKVEKNYVDEKKYLLETGFQAKENFFEKILKNELYQELDKALRELNFQKQEAVVLKYQNDLSIYQISEIQNCPEGTVKSRIFTALKELEEKLIHLKLV